MRIEFTSSEKDLVASLVVPNKTTLVETDNEGIPIKKYSKSLSGKLVLEDDFVERWREPTEEELHYFDSASREELLHWLLLEYKESETEYWKYVSAHGALRQKLRYLEHFGINPETGQACLHIKTYRKEPIEPQIEEAQLALSMITPVAVERLSKKSEGPAKVIGVSDFTLGEDGVYELVCFGDVYEFVRLVYHHPTLIRTFTHLEQAMRYIIKYHYHSDAH